MQSVGLPITDIRCFEYHEKAQALIKNNGGPITARDWQRFNNLGSSDQATRQLNPLGWQWGLYEGSPSCRTQWGAPNSGIYVGASGLGVGVGVIRTTL